MSSKKWLCMFALTIVLVLLSCAGVNILVDPFGVFGDPLLDWYGYNETNNPRVAKIAWLEQHHQNYDSYVIGSSSAASYSVEDLNHYLGGSFYNLFVYGCDTKDYRDLAAYVLEHYEVKHIVLNLGLNEGRSYDEGEGLNHRMHALTTGESLPRFYWDYAFCNPQYSWDKLISALRDSDLPQVFDVFEPLSGCYDKRLRDIEKIGDSLVYEQQHGADFVTQESPDLPYIDACVGVVAEIRDMCAAKGAELTVICSPVYISQWEATEESQLLAFKSALAEVVDYWDFSYTALSFDSRYFYDATHFRNAAGRMVLAEIFGNEDIWRPENFGHYIPAGTQPEQLRTLFSSSPAMDPADYSVDVPILLYHHLCEDAQGDMQISPQDFEAHLRALSEAGCHTVSLRQLIDYVYHGGTLPENPVCITFDDGYLSNYELAWPLLQQYGMNAGIFSIGVSVGKDTYKDSGEAIFPHFSYEQAREMLSSGSMELQSHTYDMHQSEDWESAKYPRCTIVPLPGESEEDYAAALREDLAIYADRWAEETGESFYALAYPQGEYTDATEVLVHEAGIPLTLSTRTDSRNVLVRGLPQSLYALCRMTLSGENDVQELMDYVRGNTTP